MSADILAGGRYRVEEVVGGGGMATVYRGHDAELDRPVAVKVLAENVVADPEFRERFLREARVAAKLLHPNIVQVYDVGEDDGGRPFIVMELIEGDTLAQRARGRRLRVDEVVDVATQVCAGLQHAHDHGVVHRDVKPGNLLHRRDGLVKIADFGIARAAEATQLTEVGTVLGTAAYLSPEQAAGEEVGPAADLYSLGVVVYELLTGRTPFQFGSLAELAAKQREGAVTPVRELAPAVPPPLEDVVMRCLARNPAYRPGSAAELGQELSAVLEAPTAPLQHVSPPRRRRPEWVWLAAAVAAALVVLAIALALASGGSKSPPRKPSVTPIARGSTPADEARNLGDWLRKYSR